MTFPALRGPPRLSENRSTGHRYCCIVTNIEDHDRPWLDLEAVGKDGRPSIAIGLGSIIGVPKWWICETKPFTGEIEGAVILFSPNLKSALINAAVLGFDVEGGDLEVIQFRHACPGEWMHRRISGEELGEFPPFGGVI